MIILNGDKYSPIRGEFDNEPCEITYDEETKEFTITEKRILIEDIKINGEIKIKAIRGKINE